MLFVFIVSFEVILFHLCVHSFVFVVHSFCHFLHLFSSFRFTVLFLLWFVINICWKVFGIKSYSSEILSYSFLAQNTCTCTMIILWITAFWHPHLVPSHYIHCSFTQIKVHWCRIGFSLHQANYMCDWIHSNSFFGIGQS